MKVLNKQLVLKFANRHADCRKALFSLIAVLEAIEWKTPKDVEYMVPGVRIINGNNLVLRICGNRYRLWLKVAYEQGTITFKRIGLHSDYARWRIG